MSESVILCEGYHDRSFWSGWLERLGFTDARRRPDGSIGEAIDPFGRRVAGGDFGFRSRAGSFLRVRPCGGDSKVLDAIQLRLSDRVRKPITHLVVNLDTDADDASSSEERARALASAIENRVHQAAPGAVRTNGGALSIDGGATLISLVLWSAPDPATPELPAKQTLERLVCAALRSAYPQRAADVAAWLASRKGPPPGTSGLVKEHAWSHMAGWYAGHNCDDFYQVVWRDERAATELEARLHASGALGLMTSLAGS